jgi:hypothetical protein
MVDGTILIPKDIVGVMVPRANALLKKTLANGVNPFDGALEAVTDVTVFTNSHPMMEKLIVIGELINHFVRITNELDRVVLGSVVHCDLR